MLQNIAVNGCSAKVDVLAVGLLDAPRQVIFKPYATAYTLDCTTLDLALPAVRRDGGQDGH